MKGTTEEKEIATSSTHRQNLIARPPETTISNSGLSNVPPADPRESANWAGRNTKCAKLCGISGSYNKRFFNLESH